MTRLVSKIKVGDIGSATRGLGWCYQQGEPLMSTVKLMIDGDTGMCSQMEVYKHQENDIWRYLFYSYTISIGAYRVVHFKHKASKAWVYNVDKLL